jgi:ABC-type glycerol-3-phosphate transport system permease component
MMSEGARTPDAFAHPRFRFKRRQSFVLAITLVQMLPAEAMLIAQYQMISGLGLLNSLAGVSIIDVAMVVPFTIPLWLRDIAQQSNLGAPEWSHIMAGSVLVAAPVVVFFVIVLGHMAQSFVGGAVRG